MPLVYACISAYACVYPCVYLCIAHWTGWGGGGGGGGGGLPGLQQQVIVSVQSSKTIATSVNRYVWLRDML